MGDDHKPKARLVAELDELSRKPAVEERPDAAREHAASSESAEERCVGNACPDPGTEGFNPYRNVPAMLLSLDSRSRILDVSDYLLRAAGYDRDRVVGRPMTEFLSESSKRRALEHTVPTVFHSGSVNDEEIEVIKSDGTPMQVLLSAVLERDSGGKAVGALAALSDVTALKQTEEALRESEEKYRLLVDKATQAVFIVRDGRIVFANPRALELSGYNEEDIGRRTFLQFIHPHDRTMVFERLMNRIQGRESSEISAFRIIDRLGDVKWVQAGGMLISWRGTPAALFFINDITTRKEVEAALQASEEKYRLVVENANDMIFVIQDGVMKFANPKTMELSGYSDDTFASRPFVEFVHPDDRESVSRALLADSKGPNIPAGRPFRVIEKQGSVRWSYLTVVSIDWNGRPAALAFATDINELKKAEEALRESEEKYRLLVDNAPLGIVAVDTQGVVVQCNPIAVTMLGLDPDCSDVGAHLLSNPRFEASGIAEDIRACIHENTAAIEEKPYILPNGETSYLRVNLVPVRDAEGYVVGAQAIFEDITDRKRAEEELTRAHDELELRVQERTADLQTANEEIKRFAYIVSHDLRVPLMSIKVFGRQLSNALTVVESAVQRVAEGPATDDLPAVMNAFDKEIPEALSFIHSATERMERFINAVLKLSRLGRRDLVPEPVDISDVVAAGLRSLAHRIDEHPAAVTVEELPEVVTDRIAMDQIFGNLLTNAVTYLKPGIPGNIVVAARESDTAVTFSVSDNGRGIRPEEMNKVFDFFHRGGKQDVPGEGMGLAYVKTLVRRLGGRIWCESEPGIGSTFFVSIPKRIPESDPA